MSKYLVCGAGGFIGGYITKKLIEEGHSVTCVDIKPLDLWFQFHDSASNFSLDLKILENCEKIVEAKILLSIWCNMGE